MAALRRNRCVALLTTLSAVLFLVPAHAQVTPSAYGAEASLWVGTEYSNVSASFPYQSGQRLQGIGIFADFYPNNRLGLEGNVRFLPWGGFEGSTESSYLAGPKIFFFTRRQLRPYGKFLVGAGKIHYPFNIGDATYLALAPGAGAEYHLNHRWMLRVDYEYQIWHNSPGYVNVPDHQLTPNGFHLGIAYRLSP